MAGEGRVVVDMLYEMSVYQYTKSAGIMLILWLCYVCSKVECIVDFGWVFCHFVIGLTLTLQYYTRVNYRGWVMLACLSLWFFCLGGMLFIRVISGYQDKRYQALAANSTKKNIFFFVQYQFQAVLIFFTSLPLYFTFRQYTETEGEVRWTFVVGAVLCLFGTLMEALADAQLRRYKKVKELLKNQKEDMIKATQDDNGPLINRNDYEDPRFPGVLKTGLWSRSRHPNLFFETVTWLGFAVAGLNDFSVSFIGFVGPVTLFCIMYFLTIPITEKSMANSRPYWEEYTKHTNKFLPFL